MAEIYVQDGETKEEVARRLLDQASHPDHVVWQPRSGQEAGGVFLVPDDEVDDLIARVESKRRAETERTERIVAAADERDELADRTGLTPDQLGFSANATGDPGSFPVEDVVDVVDEDDEETEETDPDGDDAAPDEAPTEEAPAISRAAARKAARKKAADDAAAADSINTDKE